MILLLGVLLELGILFLALSLEGNYTLNKKLEADWINYAVFPGAGKDAIGDWPPEISFFVGNISKEHAQFLGNKYEQNVIVFGAIIELSELIILV